MKYSAQQRMQKIYEYAFKLVGYIKSNDIEKENLYKG